MSLTAVAIRNARPRPKPYKLTDGAGLYLLINPNGSKLWRLDYRFEGRRKTLALGAFPEKGLAEARDERDHAKRRLRAGSDPSGGARARLRGTPAVDRQSLRSVATRWFAAREGAWVPSYSSRIWSRIEHDILPELGARPIAEVTPEELLAALRRIEGRGAIEMARRVKNHLHDLFKFARSERLIEANPCDDLGDAMATPAPPKGRAALKARELPDFLRALNSYDGDPRTKLAIRFTLLTFVRTNEVRFAAWDEFEGFESKEPLWRIPAERMKMRDEHLVPLAPQVVKLLEDAKALSGSSRYVFTGVSGGGVMSENTMIFAVYRMGYHRRATIHGFRGTASTVLNENGFNRDWIERQLAHSERDDVRAAYNSAEWLPQRRKMMCWWADYLDRCTTSAAGTASPSAF